MRAAVAVATLIWLAVWWRHVVRRRGSFSAWWLVLYTAAGVWGIVTLTGWRWSSVPVAAVSAGIAVWDVWPILFPRSGL